LTKIGGSSYTFCYTSFYQQRAKQGIKHNCTTVMCGHIHHPDDKIINGVRYLNTLIPGGIVA
jgi:UDP-2,3-diacylglucosamine pyrophosphatase LpxH